MTIYRVEHLKSLLSTICTGKCKEIHIRNKEGRKIKTTNYEYEKMIGYIGLTAIIVNKHISISTTHINVRHGRRIE